MLILLSLLFAVSEATPAPTVYTCVAYSENTCAKVLTDMGIGLGYDPYPFSDGSYGTKGCYYYNSGEYAGYGFYGTGGTTQEMADTNLPLNRLRPYGYDCPPTHAPTSAPTSAPTHTPTVAPTVAPTKSPTTAAPSYHQCDDGTHGCDVAGGICIVNGTEWQCACDHGYWCSAGCEHPYAAHTCVADTQHPSAAPTSAPTTTPTVHPTQTPTKSPTTSAPSLPTTAPTTSAPVQTTSDEDAFTSSTEFRVLLGLTIVTLLIVCWWGVRVTNGKNYVKTNAVAVEREFLIIDSLQTFKE